ncbi:tyrosine protein kinase [Bacillus cereus]|nr:tyrosine protein kinase [Bacillus cereus]
MKLRTIFQKETTKHRRYQPIAHRQPKSTIAEQYRHIRTSIDFASVTNKKRSLVITSVNPGEGKTTTASNLATVIAQQGKRVLIIDADLRKPALHQVFQVNNILGLTNVLTGNKTFEKCIQKTIVPNLDFLPCGPIPPNPVELLGSQAMKILITDINKDYDLVIFDLPPILPVTDAQIMANQCDLSILVLRSQHTEKKEAIKAKTLLDNTNSKLLGVILNDHECDHSNYYYGTN